MKNGSWKVRFEERKWLMGWEWGIGSWGGSAARASVTPDCEESWGGRRRGQAWSNETNSRAQGELWNPGRQVHGGHAERGGIPSLSRLSEMFILLSPLSGGCVRHDEVETRGKPGKLMHPQQWLRAVFKLLALHLLCCVGRGSNSYTTAA